MPARFNHMIIAARSREESAAFYRRLLEAEAAPSWGAFANVLLADGVLLQFAQPPVDFPPQHYAFLVTDDHFERAMARIRAEKRQHWADPQRQQPGRTNTEHGGRGVYLLDPAGHYLELLTRPYL
jgi:catechol 2,3-dioxygenase-like lactoylglutathione lyase family enzyme